MAIIFIDNTRKYKFLNDYYFQLGERIYQIKGIEGLRWKEASGDCSATSTLTTDFDTYLKPLDGFAYFIEEFGIDGNLGFAFQFPKGIVHGAPRGETQYIYADEAPYNRPIYMPFIITPPHYPTFEFYNPKSSTFNADMYFFGERWRVRNASPNEVPNIDAIPRLTDYASSGIGQG